MMVPDKYERWLFPKKSSPPVCHSALVAESIVPPGILLDTDFRQYDNIAIIPIHGVLTKRAGLLDGVLNSTSYESIHGQFLKALESEATTIIFDIDSPGGETGGLFELCDAIYSVRGRKNIWAVANDDCFSAAYAIASSCDKIFINKTSGVGSIGVIAHHMDQSGYDEKQGVKYKTIYAGARKNDGNPHEPPTDESLKSLDTEVHRLYEMFVNLVSRNRGLTPDYIKQTEAGLYYGDNAFKAGLADEFGTLTEILKRNFSMTETTPDLRAEGRVQCLKELQEIIRLCRIAHMPEKVAECIEKEMTIEGAREHLMAIMAEKSNPEIISSVGPETHMTNPMIEAAKQRGVTHART